MLLEVFSSAWEEKGKRNRTRNRKKKKYGRWNEIERRTVKYNRSRKEKEGTERHGKRHQNGCER